MDVQIVNLFERPDDLLVVAGWIYREFWRDTDVHTAESLAGLLGQAVEEEEIPLSLVACVEGKAVGTVNLVENDDDARAHLRPWLAALYVEPEYRRRGVGSALVGELQRRAEAMGIGELYLGTDNPGFYERLGAVVHEQVNPEFCVMRLDVQ